jgi:enoyl-CoA hydratase/carnithine racemase
MRPSQVEVSRSGHVETVRLTATERLNALTHEDMDDLRTAFRRAEADPEVRCIVITGTGRAFCSGAHVGGLAKRAAARQAASVSASGPEAAPAGPTAAGAFTPRRMGIFKPVIVAVNGVTAGAGLHFIADADLVIAAASATFVDTHTSIGQVTALEPMLFVRGGVPINQVMRMVILGRAGRISAQEACRIGLVSEVVPDEQLAERAQELGDLASSVSPAAVQRSIEAIWSALELPLSEAYARGQAAIMDHRSHPDALEGAQAFVEKRAPRWYTGEP